MSASPGPGRPGRAPCRGAAGARGRRAGPPLPVDQVRGRVAPVEQAYGRPVGGDLRQQGRGEVLVGRRPARPGRLPGQRLVEPPGQLGQGGGVLGLLAEGADGDGDRGDGLEPLAPDVPDQQPGPEGGVLDGVEVPADPGLGLGRRVARGHRQRAGGGGRVRQHGQLDGLRDAPGPGQLLHLAGQEPVHHEGQRADQPHHRQVDVGGVGGPPVVQVERQGQRAGGARDDGRGPEREHRPGHQTGRGQQWEAHVGAGARRFSRRPPTSASTASAQGRVARERESVGHEAPCRRTVGLTGIHHSIWPPAPQAPGGGPTRRGRFSATWALRSAPPTTACSPAPEAKPSRWPRSSGSGLSTGIPSTRRAGLLESPRIRHPDGSGGDAELGDDGGPMMTHHRFGAGRAVAVAAAGVLLAGCGSAGSRAGEDPEPKPSASVKQAGESTEPSGSPDPKKPAESKEPGRCPARTTSRPARTGSRKRRPRPAG